MRQALKKVNIARNGTAADFGKLFANMLFTANEKARQRNYVMPRWRWKCMMLNGSRDTNTSHPAWRQALRLICALCCFSPRSQTLLRQRRGRRSITRGKWPLALILISAGLEQISLHLSPYRKLSQTTTPSLSEHPEAAASAFLRDTANAAGTGESILVIILVADKGIDCKHLLPQLRLLDSSGKGEEDKAASRRVGDWCACVYL